VRASALLFSRTLLLSRHRRRSISPSFPSLVPPFGQRPLYFRTSVHFYKSSDVPRRVPPSHSHASRHRIRLAVSYNASEERARGRKRGEAGRLSFGDLIRESGGRLIHFGSRRSATEIDPAVMHAETRATLPRA